MKDFFLYFHHFKSQREKILFFHCLKNMLNITNNINLRVKSSKSINEVLKSEESIAMKGSILLSVKSILLHRVVTNRALVLPFSYFFDPLILHGHSNFLLF